MAEQHCVGKHPEEECRSDAPQDRQKFDTFGRTSLPRSDDNGDHANDRCAEVEIRRELLCALVEALLLAVDARHGGDPSTPAFDDLALTSDACRLPGNRDN